MRAAFTLIITLAALPESWAKELVIAGSENWYEATPSHPETKLFLDLRHTYFGPRLGQWTDKLIAGLTIPNITAGDLGSTFVVTESNAADYGLNWQKFDDGMRVQPQPPYLDGGYQGVWKFNWGLIRGSYKGQGGTILAPSLYQSPLPYLKTWETQRIELEFLPYWLNMRVVGEGTINIIPEPSALALCLIAAVGLAGWRKRGRQ